MRRSRDVLLEALHMFKSVDRAVTVHQIMAFLYICENEGLSVQELGDAAGFSQAAASRNLAVLGLADPDASTSLVQALPHPSDGRSRLIRLTARGRELRDRLDTVIRRGVPIVVDREDAYAPGDRTTDPLVEPACFAPQGRSASG